MEILGQILSFVSFGIAFAVYQIKSKKRLLCVQTILVIVTSIHYFCLEAYPGMVMNLFCILRNVIYYRKDIFKWKFTPIIVSLLMMLVGIFAATDMWSILVIAGLTINTYCLSFENTQHFRISILITSPLVLIYNIIVFSLGGILMEAISIISATIGIVRNFKTYTYQ